LEKVTVMGMGMAREMVTETVMAKERVTELAKAMEYLAHPAH